MHPAGQQQDAVGDLEARTTGGTPDVTDIDEVARAEKWGALAADVTTAIHEVLGHGSGRVADHLNGQPQLAIKEHYSALEESRADLGALYFVGRSEEHTSELQSH